MLLSSVGKQTRRGWRRRFAAQYAMHSSARALERPDATIKAIHNTQLSAPMNSNIDSMVRLLTGSMRVSPPLTKLLNEDYIRTATSVPTKTTESLYRWVAMNCGYPTFSLCHRCTFLNCPKVLPTYMTSPNFRADLVTLSTPVLFHVAARSCRLRCVPERSIMPLYTIVF